MERLVFAAQLGNLQAMIDFIRAKAAANGFIGERIDRIQLACEEVLVNVINYAYPGKNGDLEIAIESVEKGLKITVADSGIPFDPLSLPMPDINAPMEERRIGGLGIYLMRKIMDEVTYRRENDRNILTMVKYKN